MSNQLTIVIKGDAAQFSRTIKQVEAGINRAQGATRNFGHSTVSNTQAASAAIRLMEGDITNLVRAAERFVGQSQVLSGVLKTAFPAIGAIAIAGVIGRGVEQVVKFVEAARKMPKALQDGFQSVTLTGDLAVDELRKTNDELENNIAKLEGKPQNNLVIAIDDARIAADKLAKSLMEDQKQVLELLKTNNIGIWQALVTPEQRTSAMAGVVNYWEQQRADGGFAYQQAVRTNGPDSDQAKKAKTALDDVQRRAEQNMQSEISKRSGMVQTPNGDYVPYAAVYGGQTGNLNIAKGYLSDLQNQDDLEAQQKRNEADNKKQQALQHAKELADAQKQAQEKIIQAWQQGLDRAKALYGYSENDEANYWLHMAGTVKTGSLAYQKAVDNANKLIASQMKTLGQERDKWLAAQTSPTGTFANSQGQQQAGAAKFGGEDIHDLSKDSDVTRGISEQSKAIVEWLKNLNDARDIQKANANAMAEASLQMAVATGQLTRHDAALVQARLHTQEYTEAYEKLLQARLAIATMPGLSDAERKQQLSANSNQIAILNGQRAVQVASDSEIERATTALGQLHDSTLRLADDFTDLGRQLSDLVTNTLTSLNQNLSQALMAHAYNGREYRRGITNALGNTARGAGSEMLNDVFEQIEGSALKKLIGKNPNQKKPKGTQDDPIYTKDAGQSQSGGGGLLGGLLGKIMGKFLGGGGSILDLGSGGMGSLGPGSLPSIFGDSAPSMDLSGMGDTGTMIPGFAGGGDFLANRPMIVGERGPELVSFGSPGHVTPNHQLFGGDTHYHYVDARGATDPAATEAALHRAMQKYVPQSAAMGAKAIVEMNRRRSSRARV